MSLFIFFSFTEKSKLHHACPLPHITFSRCVAKSRKYC